MCFDVFGCVWEKNKRERREKIRLETAQNSFFSLHNEGFGGIFIEKVALELPAHLVEPPASLLSLAILAFSQLNFKCIFEGLPRLGLS